MKIVSAKLISPIFLCTLFLWSIFIIWLGNNVLITTDAQKYAILAKNVIEGKGFGLAGKPELIFPPGYTFALIPFLIFQISLEKAVSVLSSVSTFLLGLFVYKLVSLLSRKTALFTSIFVLANGNIALWSALGMVEPIWLFSIVASFYFFLVDGEKSFFLSGLFAGFSYLLKPESVAYIFIFVVLYYIKKNVRIKPLLLFFLPLLVIIFLYSFWFYRQTGKISISGKTATIYWDSYIENKSIVRDEIVYSLRSDLTIGTTIKDGRVVETDLAKRIRENIPSFKLALFEILLPLRITLFVLLLSFILLREKRSFYIYISVFLLPTVSVLLFHIENRYLMTFLVLTILLLSSTLVSAAKKKGFRYKTVAFISFLTLILVTYYSYLPLRKEFKNLRDEKIKIKTITESLDVQNNLILARKPVYSFYLEKDYYSIPWVENLDDLQRFLAAQKEYVIILDEWSMKTMPVTHTLIEQNHEGMGLEKVKYSKDNNITVYEKKL